MLEVDLSVRSLVEFVLRSGNLEGGRFVARDRAVDGIRGHKKLQQSRPADYQMEVHLSHKVMIQDAVFTLTGRADGIMTDSNGTILEEIKTIVGAYDPAGSDNEIHWGQAKLYAWMISTQNDLDAVQVQMTYVRLDPWEEYEDRRDFSHSELDEFAVELITRYLAWSRAYLEWTSQRDVSISNLNFPFPEYRPGQRRFAVAVYRTIESQCRLFAQAPTGIGKTVSTIFPALKALGEGILDKIWYLTAKTIGRTVAEGTIEILRKEGLAVKSITLTARDKICFNPNAQPRCDPEHCEFAIGYFDRINDALVDALRTDALTRSTIEEVARRHTVCPFELSLDLSIWADIVICDYNYVFDPRAYIRRFFQEDTGRHVFLIDEAHNLVDRAREMYSATLRKENILNLRRAIKSNQPAVARALASINRHFLSYRKECEASDSGEYWTDSALPDKLVPALKRLVKTAEEILASGVAFPQRQSLLDFYFEVVAFLRISELFDDHYITYCEKSGKDVQLKLFCLDPSNLLSRNMKRGSGSVLFSATLSPLPYYRELLGGEPEDPMLSLNSPFPAENLQVIMADHIGTSYRLRDGSYQDVTESIASMVAGREGNYLVYFPSFRYLKEVENRYREAFPDSHISIQTPAMGEAEREAFLSQFHEERSHTFIAFAIMGGIFGEGIDLTGESLVGAAIVGVGLPQVSLERDLLRAYFDSQDLDGFTYAYTYPGMIRVLQAAGRVIRTDRDRGIVLLIDQRFGALGYRRLFPPWWQQVERLHNPDRIRQSAEDFWRHPD